MNTQKLARVTGSDIIGPNWRPYVPRKYFFFYKIKVFSEVIKVR